MTFLTSSSQSHTISFPEFRDFLLLLPRKASTAEIYRYYEVKKYLGDDGRGAARVTMEGEFQEYVREKMLISLFRRCHVEWGRQTSTTCDEPSSPAFSPTSDGRLSGGVR